MNNLKKLRDDLIEKLYDDLTTRNSESGTWKSTIISDGVDDSRVNQLEEKVKELEKKVRDLDWVKRVTEAGDDK
jgi:hypothetical protein